MNPPSRASGKAIVNVAGSVRTRPSGRSCTAITGAPAPRIHRRLPRAISHRVRYLRGDSPALSSGSPARPRIQPLHPRQLQFRRCRQWSHCLRTPQQPLQEQAPNASRQPPIEARKEPTRRNCLAAPLAGMLITLDTRLRHDSLYTKASPFDNAVKPRATASSGQRMEARAPWAASSGAPSGP